MTTYLFSLCIRPGYRGGAGERAQVHVRGSKHSVVFNKNIGPFYSGRVNIVLKNRCQQTSILNKNQRLISALGKKNP